MPCDLCFRPSDSISISKEGGWWPRWTYWQFNNWFRPQTPPLPSSEAMAAFCSPRCHPATLPCLHQKMSATSQHSVLYISSTHGPKGPTARRCVQRVPKCLGESYHPATPVCKSVEASSRLGRAGRAREKSFWDDRLAACLPVSQNSANGELIKR